MYGYTLLILAVLGGLHYTTAQTGNDWCGLASCNPYQHIDCTRGDGSFAPSCPDSAVMLDLSAVTVMIPDMFNTFRNVIAGGGLGFGTASRMGTLKWNVTLANLARKNTKECIITWHDNCRNTPDQDYVGQNTAYYIDTRTSAQTNWGAIQEMIYLMFNQSSYATPADVKSYPADGYKKYISSFTQAVKDDANRVGCASIHYLSKIMLSGVATECQVWQLTCNFQKTNVVGKPTYIQGAATSGCLTGPNPSYPKLCSETEFYDVNAL